MAGTQRELPFIKMHGLGNDFVFLNGLETDPGLTPEQVVALCDRRTGIGADGTVIVRRCAEADYWMDYRNSDGTPAEMCGNALRCLGAFVRREGDEQRETFTVLTGAGVKTLTVARNGQAAPEVTVNMGPPVLERARIPMLGEPAARVVNEPLRVGGRDVRITAVQTGNPHAVQFVDDIDAVPLHVWGPAMETHAAFPQKVNAEFAQIVDRENIRLRVWERGCGETLACGSGAVAAAVAASLNDLTGRAVNVHLALGALRIEWRESGDVFMTGPTAEAFRGVWRG